MKKLHLLKRTLLLFALIVGCVNYGWADTSTLTFTAACGGSGTADDGTSWTVTSDAAESTFVDDGIHYGTNKASVQYVQLTTSDIIGTISSVVVTTRDTNAKAAVTVTVGGEAFKCGGKTSATATNTSTGYTFTGSGSGTIIVRVDRGAAETKAIYVKSVVVTYSTGPAYTITAQSNNIAYGTVSLSGSVITGSPNSGYRYASPAYTVDPAESATVSQEGNEFTVIPSANTTVTINFEAIPSHTATFSVNGVTSTNDFAEGASIEFPADPEDINGKKFVGWVTDAIDGTTDDEPSFVTSAIMGDTNITYYAVFATLIPGTGTVKYDNLTTSTFGSPSSYTTWSGKQATDGSDAVYAGESSGGSSYIQIRATSPSGIVTTTSGGKAKKVTVTWNDATTSGRTLDIYGKNTAYTESANLYNDSYKGTELGSIVYGTSTELTITGDYEYIGMRSNSGAMYLDKIVVDWQTGTPDTYSAYCTTVSSLPIPVITLSADAIEMTWGDEDKVLTASAKVGGEAYEGTITMTPSSPNLTIDGEGNIRCNVPGEYTITASIAETAEHQAAEKTCTVTVSKKNATVAFATKTVQKMLSDVSYTQAATKDPVAAGAITYTISPSENTINSETGEVTLSATGNYTVTATAAENALYNEASDSYTLQVRDVPTIVVADAPVTYGNTFVVDGSVIEGGDITVSSGNEDIATVDGLTITPVAVGTVTITVSTAASDDYVEGEETFVLTVNAPAGGTEKYIPLETVFSETFAGCEGTGGNDGEWSGTIASATLNFDNVGWGSANGAGANQCGKFGASSKKGSATTPALGKTGTLNLTFRAGAWNGNSEGTTLNLFVSDGATIDKSSVTLTKGSFNTFTATITNATVDTKITFEAANASNNRFFLDDVKVTKAGSPITVTLNGYGYATYCSQYPLDFSKASGYSAWQITSVGTEGAITFEKVKGSVKGGTGLLLKGEDGATITLTSEDSETVLSGNHLVGTLAPLNVNADEYYGLSGNKFVKVSAGNVPAGKALLPVTSIPSSAHQLSFIFEDEGETTGISEVRGLKTDVRGEYFNLNGQRVATPVKGNIYIVNGKKVMFK